MADMVTQPVREIRAHLGDVIDRAARDQTTVITRNGKEVAAVVSMDLLRKFQMLEDEADLRAIADSDAALAAGAPLHSFDDVLRETLERGR